MTGTVQIRSDEKLAIDLMGAIRASAEAVCAPDPVELVSVTVDVSARTDATGQPQFHSRVDRKTRTILFTGGHAEIAGQTVMTATAVYRISPAG